MHVTLPEGFCPIAEEDFEQFLAMCPDYERDAYNVVFYKFRHNQKRFAYVTGFGTPQQRIFADPSLLTVCG